MHRLLLSAVNLCKQFRLILGPTECRSRSGSKLFDTLIVLLKEFLEKVNFEKWQQTTTKNEELMGYLHYIKFCSHLIQW